MNLSHPTEPKEPDAKQGTLGCAWKCKRIQGNRSGSVVFTKKPEGTLGGDGCICSPGGLTGVHVSTLNTGAGAGTSRLIVVSTMYSLIIALFICVICLLPIIAIIFVSFLMIYLLGSDGW